MIPTIGVMIGAYTITRLVAHIVRPGEWFSRIWAIAAVLIIAFCTIDLLLSGRSSPPSFPTP
jgi:hypothetical protein